MVFRPERAAVSCAPGHRRDSREAPPTVGWNGCASRAHHIGCLFDYCAEQGLAAAQGFAAAQGLLAAYGFVAPQGFVAEHGFCAADDADWTVG